MKTLRNFRAKTHRRNAFTILELIFVIIIIGILAALALPRYERDIRQEAADNILSAIRMARLMALTDDVTDPRHNDWQKAFWRFGIEGCSDNGIFYYVASDKDRQGGIDTNEIVNDPANGLHMMGDNSKPCEKKAQQGASPNIFLTHKYGIADGDISFCGNNPQQGPNYIGFDHMGRPHQGFATTSSSGGSTAPDYNTILHQDCNITVNFSQSGADPVTIVVEKGTGHTYIAGENGS